MHAWKDGSGWSWICTGMARDGMGWMERGDGEIDERRE